MGFSLAIALIGSALLVPSILNTQHVADVYYKYATIPPPYYVNPAHSRLSLTNITVVPLNFGRHAEYFSRPAAISGYFYAGMVGMAGLGYTFPTFLIAGNFAKLDKKEAGWGMLWAGVFYAGEIFFGGLYVRGSRCLATLMLTPLPLPYFFNLTAFLGVFNYSNAQEYRLKNDGNLESADLFALINTTLLFSFYYFCYVFCLGMSPDPDVKKAKWKASWMLWKFEFLTQIIALLFALILLPQFFNAGTHPLMRALIRGVFVGLSISVSIEIGGRTSTHLVTKFGLSVTTSHMLMLRPLFMMSLVARAMQGSAATLLEALFYEIIGTLTELFTADQLLRGVLPSMDMIRFLVKWGMLRPQRAKHCRRWRPSCMAPMAGSKRRASSVTPARCSRRQTPRCDPAWRTRRARKTSSAGTSALRP